MMQNKNGKITVTMELDKNNNLYVVTRKTPKTLWQDRYNDFTRALKRYREYLYLSNKELEKRLLLK